MAFTWIDGERQSLDIEWIHVSGTCPVRSDAELLRVTVIAETTGLEGHGFFDLFQLRKNLTNEKIVGAEVAFIPLDEIPAGQVVEIPVFGAVKDAEIVAAHIVPKETITGSDSSYVQLRLVNKETNDTICTKTFIAGIDAPAFVVTDFGPVDETAKEISVGHAVALVKEDFGSGMCLPQSILIIEWNLR